MYFFVISDPYEIEQKEIDLEVIGQVRKNLYRKLLYQKDTTGFYEFLCSHFFTKDYQEHKVEEMLRNFISSHMPQEPQVELPKLY